MQAHYSLSSPENGNPSNSMFSLAYYWEKTLPQVQIQVILVAGEMVRYQFFIPNCFLLKPGSHTPPSEPAVIARDKLRFGDKCSQMLLRCPRYVGGIWEPGFNENDDQMTSEGFLIDFLGLTAFNFGFRPCTRAMAIEVTFLNIERSSQRFRNWSNVEKELRRK